MTDLKFTTLVAERCARRQCEKVIALLEAEFPIRPGDAELRGAGLNVQETENVIFDGAEAAVARINLDGPPARHTLDAVRDHTHVLDVQLIALS